MKTSLAIVFAAAALMLSATVATARFESYSGKSPGGVFTVQAPLPSPRRSSRSPYLSWTSAFRAFAGPYRGNR